MKSLAEPREETSAFQSGTDMFGIGPSVALRIDQREAQAAAPWTGSGGLIASADMPEGPPTIRCSRSTAEIEALAAAWRALEERCTSPVFFQSYAWCRHVLDTLAEGSAAHPACDPVQPLILTAWRGERLLALWPLQVKRECGARIVTDLSAPFGQYADVLIDADSVTDGQDLCRHLLAEVKRASRADALMLRKVRLDTPIGRVLATSARVLDEPQHAPFVSMAGHASFEAFHATAKAKTRKNVRNSTHRLEKLGAVSHRVERRTSGMQEALRNCFDLRSTWLDRMGLTSTAFAHPAFADLVRGLAEPDRHGVDVLSMMLTLDEQPISIHYGFLHQRRYYAFMAARNPEFDACSPGKVHLEHVLRTCHAMGAETVDLLAPDMAYKSVWATGAVEIADFGLTWSVRGWFANEIWRRRLRPLSRSLFLALPAMARQRIAARHRSPRH